MRPTPSEAATVLQIVYAALPEMRPVRRRLRPVAQDLARARMSTSSTTELWDAARAGGLSGIEARTVLRNLQQLPLTPVEALWKLGMALDEAAMRVAVAIDAALPAQWNANPVRDEPGWRVAILTALNVREGVRVVVNTVRTLRGLDADALEILRLTDVWLRSSLPDAYDTLESVYEEADRYLEARDDEPFRAAYFVAQAVVISVRGSQAEACDAAAEAVRSAATASALNLGRRRRDQHREYATIVRSLTKVPSIEAWLRGL